MSITEEKMKKSERAYDVFRFIHKLEEPTPSKVAEELDSSANALRRYFIALEDLHFIDYRRAGRKKIYEIKWHNVYNYWEIAIADLVTGGKMPGVNASMEEGLGLDEHQGVADRISNISLALQTRDSEEHFFDENFMHNYFENYISRNQNSTLNNMFLHDFVEGIRRARFNYRDKPFVEIDVEVLDEWEIGLIISSFLIETHYLDEYEPDRSDSLLDTLLEYEEDKGVDYIKRRFRENWR